MNLKDKNEIIKAMSKNDNNKIKFLISSKPELINTTNEFGYNLTALACHNNNTEALKFLLENNAPFEPDSAFLCSSHGYSEPLSYLIDNKFIAVNLLREPEQDTLLMAAAQEGNLGLVKKLISYGIDINTKNIKGSTALSLSAQYGEMEVFKYLIKKNADISSLKTLNKNNLDSKIIEIIQSLEEKESLEEIISHKHKAISKKL